LKVRACPFKRKFLENVAQIRSQNRRVDVLLVKKKYFKYLQLICKDNQCRETAFSLKIFYLTWAVTDFKKQKENSIAIATILDKKRNVEFEIRGHVCCTLNEFADAIEQSY
jgi:hypothetical protein